MSTLRHAAAPAQNGQRTAHPRSADYRLDTVCACQYVADYGYRPAGSPDRKYDSGWRGVADPAGFDSDCRSHLHRQRIGATGQITDYVLPVLERQQRSAGQATPAHGALPDHGVYRQMVDAGRIRGGDPGQRRHVVRAVRDHGHVVEPRLSAIELGLLPTNLDRRVDVRGQPGDDPGRRRGRG